MNQYNNLNRELFEHHLEMDQVEVLPEKLQQILDQYKVQLQQQEYQIQEYRLQNLSFKEILFPFIFFQSFFTLQPNQACVIECFGKPVKTIKKKGLCWYPKIFTEVFFIDRKVQSFDLSHIKIPDKNGSTLDISIVINYTIDDPVMYLYGTDDLYYFIEGAVYEITKKVISNFSYSNSEDEINLLNDQKVISEAFRQMINHKLKAAGIKVLRMQFTELFYEKEIAQQLLQKQVAIAKIEASEQIVKGATGILKDIVDDQELTSILTNEQIKNELYEKIFLIISSDFSNSNSNKLKQKNTYKISQETKNFLQGIQRENRISQIFRYVDNEQLYYIQMLIGNLQLFTNQAHRDLFLLLSFFIRIIHCQYFYIQLLSYLISQ